MRCKISLVSAKNWSKPQHFSWSASRMLASTGVRRLWRPLKHTHTIRQASPHQPERLRDSDVLWEAAGDRHLWAPLDLSVLKLLMAWDRARRLLCDDLIPAEITNNQVTNSSWSNRWSWGVFDGTYITSLFLRGPSKGLNGRLPVAAW